MATWKKVIVSGSNAELNDVHLTGDITGSTATIGAGIVSCSGKWFGNLDVTEDQTYVGTYNTSNGEFKFRELSSFPGFG